MRLGWIWSKPGIYPKCYAFLRVLSPLYAMSIRVRTRYSNLSCTGLSVIVLLLRMSTVFFLTPQQMAKIARFFPLSHGVLPVDDRRVISGIICPTLRITMEKCAQSVWSAQNPSFIIVVCVGVAFACFNACSISWQTRDPRLSTS